jgi:hypothetical protein
VYIELKRFKAHNLKGLLNVVLTHKAYCGLPEAAVGAIRDGSSGLRVLVLADGLDELQMNLDSVAKRRALHNLIDQLCGGPGHGWAPHVVKVSDCKDPSQPFGATTCGQCGGCWPVLERPGQDFS